MAIKENEQPTYLHGSVEESAINTLTVHEISVPRILGSRLLFDIDEVVIEISVPRPTLGADALAYGSIQLVVSDDEPTTLLDPDDPALLAYRILCTLANATDTLFIREQSGFAHWMTQSHANLVPDDKVWLVIQGSANRVANVLKGNVRIKGSMAKVTIEDFEALVLSRLN